MSYDYVDKWPLAAYLWAQGFQRFDPEYQGTTIVFPFVDSPALRKAKASYEDSEYRKVSETYRYDITPAIKKLRDVQ